MIAENRFVQENNRCLKLVFSSFRWIAGGTDQCIFEQAPRDCLKNHEEVVVACGNDGSTLCYDPADGSWYELAKMQSITVTLGVTFCVINCTLLENVKMVKILLSGMILRLILG